MCKIKKLDHANSVERGMSLACTIKVPPQGVKVQLRHDKDIGFWRIQINFVLSNPFYYEISYKFWRNHLILKNVQVLEAHHKPKTSSPRKAP